MIEVLDQNGMVVTTLEPEKNHCQPYYPTDRCGGCDDCLFAQAVHYGYQTREVPDVQDGRN